MNLSDGNISLHNDGYHSVYRACQEDTSKRNNSSMKVSVLGHWVPGASHPPKFFFLFYPSKAWIPFINAPVCSVNDHPGVINPIN